MTVPVPEGPPSSATNNHMIWPNFGLSGLKIDLRLRAPLAATGQAERSEQLAALLLDGSQRLFAPEHMRAASLAAANVDIVDVGGSQPKIC